MSLFLIGHRGVGKTSLGHRLKRYFPQEIFLDLDQLIEQESGKSIEEIFQSYGEENFRKIEKNTFHKYLTKNPQVIFSLGAGFPVELIPENEEVVWVKRKTDNSGRIFLDRPRLEDSLSALDEFQKRKSERDKTFQARASWVYEMPEGLEFDDHVERNIFSKNWNLKAATITVLPEHVNHWSFFKKGLNGSNVRFLELRSDLLLKEQMEIVIQDWKGPLIFAIRNVERGQELIHMASQRDTDWIDWAMELGALPAELKSKDRLIISLHAKGKGGVSSHCMSLENFAPPQSHLKLAIPIESFVEIKACLGWMQKAPGQRSFLPCSKEGRWSWMRLYLKGKQLLNFVRDGYGSSVDQPSLYEWMQTPERMNEFAAILGHPVRHSRTPVVQAKYFSIPFLSIDLFKEEFSEALGILMKLGLRMAAVTSPLKELAFHSCVETSDIAKEFKSANSIFLRQYWHGHNTDWDGLKIFQSEVKHKNSLVIWGGGGTLKPLKKLFPHACSYSVRTGEPREGETDVDHPDVLIWAAAANADQPVKKWTPKVVIDLNYAENSLARDYALQVGARYVGGLKMFELQAEAQRRWWLSFSSS